MATAGPFPAAPPPGPRGTLAAVPPSRTRADRPVRGPVRPRAGRLRFLVLVLVVDDDHPDHHRAPGDGGPSAYVTQSLANDVAQISLTTGRIIRTIATPEGPDPIAATADERYLVAANFGDRDVGRTAT